MDKIFDVAVIGAGPSGISTAIECKINNMDVVLFEKTASSGATLQQYYKDGKRVDKIYKKQDVELKGSIDFFDGTKESTLDLFNDLLKKYEIDIRYNHEIDNVSLDDNIFIIRSSNNEIFKAKFIAICIGKMGQPNKPSYPLPPKLRKQINFNVNDCVKGEKILVVGGGNSAVEYATYLSEICDTTLNYRRKEFSRINDENAKSLELCLKNGLKPSFGVDIIGLEDCDGKIKVNFTNDTSDIFDRLVYAIGGVAPVDFLKKCNISVDGNGVPDKMDENTHESNIKNIFVSGDILFKNGGSIVIGLNHGYDIAQSIKNRI